MFLSRFIIRVSLTTHKTIGIGFSRSSSPSSHHLNHVKWCHDKSHYNHGIPGIPIDGKVVLLRNTITGSQVYLIGICHGTKESTETVKKVINAVRPGAVALELCKKRALELEKWKPGNVDLFRVFRRCLMASGSIKRKIDIFSNARQRHKTFMRGMELKVGLEECKKLKAKLVLIDQDVDVWMEQALQSLSNPNLKDLNILMTRLKRLIFPDLRSYTPLEFLIHPQLYKVWVEDRDVLMCSRLRRLEEKLIVAVVGIGHINGMELLWKRAEDVGDDECDDKLPSTTLEKGGAQAP